MRENTKKKIFIVGSSAKEYALAKKIKNYDNVSEIIVAPGNDAIREFCTCVDIREDKVQELLEFVLENAVDLTVASSETAIKNDIAGLFQANGQMIFAPTALSANFATSKTNGKKFLYKLHIPTPRFGVFEKQQLAQEYIKTSNMPVVVRTDETMDGRDRLCCTTQNLARIFVDDLYAQGEQKVLIEDYAYGHEFSVYFLTDGYSAIPLTSSANYKFTAEGDGGLLTAGVGSFAPDYKVSKAVEDNIMKNVVFNVLNSLQRRETPYLGILGVDCVLKDDNKFVILEFKTFLQDHDCQAVLNLVDENLITLFEACAIGSFADDYAKISVSDNSSVSCTLLAREAGKIISGLDLLEDSDCVSHFASKKNQYLEYETIKGRTLVVTKSAKTLTRARNYLYEEIEMISYEGKKFRRDICKDL